MGDAMPSHRFHAARQTATCASAASRQPEGAAKELIAEEVILATVQLTAAFKSGNINRC